VLVERPARRLRAVTAVAVSIIYLLQPLLTDLESKVDIKLATGVRLPGG
jgi:hypothetical protein